MGTGNNNIDDILNELIESIEVLNGNTEQFNIILQLIVDGYLFSKKQPSMSSILKTENLEDKPGVLYRSHISFLQLLIQDELNVIGINLQGEVEKNGEKFEVGKLSNFEKRYLTNKVNTLIGILKIFKDRENANKKEEN